MKNNSKIKYFLSILSYTLAFQHVIHKNPQIILIVGNVEKKLRQKE